MGKSEKTDLSLSQREECLPPWMMAMRAAARNSVSAKDIEEIVKNQVERAKKGDKAAIAFVFEQVLGGNELKGATFVQNVFNGGESPAKPTKAKPGSKEKIEAISRRIASRNGAFHEDDGEEIDLT